MSLSYNKIEIFDYFKKLRFYLNNTERGFILLNSNDFLFQKEVLSTVQKERPFKVYSLSEIEFREVLNDLKQLQPEYGLIFCFNSMQEERASAILEKINLARDLLLSQSRFYIFIAPFYVCRMIQQEYPNLHSYFILKEDYSMEYPVPFEFILPGQRYLITKDRKQRIKRRYQIDKGNLDERLEYFSITKVSEKDVAQLAKDVFQKCNEIVGRMQTDSEENADHYDFRYMFELIFKLARVLSCQGDYENSYRVYRTFDKIGMLQERYPLFFYEKSVGLGDVLFDQSKYEEALEYYRQVLIVFAEQADYEFTKPIDRQMLKIYSRMAICFNKMGQTEKAFQYMESMHRMIQNNDDLKPKEFFDIYYNYCLLLLKERPECFREIEDTLEILESARKNIIQNAMYYSIKAWYNGVVQGKLITALNDSMTALEMKREYFIENDIRIAESHYVNSMLYLFEGRYDKAEHCCNKCLNIFKNYRNRKDLYSIVNNLENEIQRRKDSI